MLALLSLLLVCIVYGVITFKFIDIDIKSIHKYHGNLIFSGITVLFWGIVVYIFSSPFHI